MREADRLRWLRLVQVLISLGTLGFVMLLIFPEWEHPIVFFLLAVPSSSWLPIPHESILLAYAPHVDWILLGVLSGAGAMVAAAIDYQTFHQVLDWEKALPLQRHRVFRAAVRWFGRAPFLTTFVFYLLPLPDYPIRILAPAARYSTTRFVVAVGLGRVPRGWALALFGAEFPWPTWLLIVLGLAIVALAALPALHGGRAPAS